MSLLVLASCATKPHPDPGPADAQHSKPIEEQVSPFGTKIIDLAFTLDDDSKRSLEKAPTVAVPAKMTFKDANGTSATDDVMIRIKGKLGSKRPLNGKPAFRVKLDNGNLFYGLKELTLNNMVQDATMLHEALGYPLYEAAGANVPSTGYANVTVNGQLYGLYLNLENIDVHFLKRRFGDDSGILYEGSYGTDLRADDVAKFELHEGTDVFYSQLRKLIAAIDAPGDDVFYGASPAVDTASFLGMMAAGTLLGDWDNYYSQNNYRIYWSPSATRWFFIPSGIDQTFRAQTAVFGGRGVLFQKCLASERCTKEYTEKVREVTARFEGLGLLEKMNDLASFIDASAKADLRKPPDAAIKKSREEMREFITQRPGIVRAALSCEGTAACAGVEIVNAANSQCLGMPDKAAKTTTVNVSNCRGGPAQRWQMVASGNDFQLASALGGICLQVSMNTGLIEQGACGSGDNQRFSMQKLSAEKPDMRLSSRRSGKCLARVSAWKLGPTLTQLPCAPTAAQTWQPRLSVYE